MYIDIEANTDRLSVQQFFANLFPVIRILKYELPNSFKRDINIAIFTHACLLKRVFSIHRYTMF